MEPKFIAILLFASLLIFIVGAQPGPQASGEDKGAMLDSALTDMKCKVAFETDFMNAIIALFPSLSSSLNPHILELQLDVTRLTQYASQEDVMNYSIYVQESFTPHIVSCAEAEQQGTAGLKDSEEDKDATKAKMKSLKSTFESLLEAKESCFSMRDHADLVINYYTKSLNMYESRAQNLSDRGVDASYLLDLVDNARGQILAPLQSEVDAATTSLEIRNALHKYCLYDGCINGTNYHMAARFETSRLTTLLEVISPNAVEAGLDRDTAHTNLDHASTRIESWGTRNANGDELKAAWDDIRSAAKELHGIYLALGGDIDTE